jgi:hypothetical protein
LVTCSIVLSLQNICVSQMKSLSTSPFIYRPLPSLSHLPLHLIKRKIKKTDVKRRVTEPENTAVKSLNTYSTLHINLFIYLYFVSLVHEE